MAAVAWTSLIVMVTEGDASPPTSVKPPTPRPPCVDKRLPGVANGSGAASRVVLVDAFAHNSFWTSTLHCSAAVPPPAIQSWRETQTKKKKWGVCVWGGCFGFVGCCGGFVVGGVGGGGRGGWGGWGVWGLCLGVGWLVVGGCVGGGLVWGVLFVCGLCFGVLCCVFLFVCVWCFWGGGGGFVGVLGVVCWGWGCGVGTSTHIKIFFVFLFFEPHPNWFFSVFFCCVVGFVWVFCFLVVFFFVFFVFLFVLVLLVFFVDFLLFCWVCCCFVVCFVVWVCLFFYFIYEFLFFGLGGVVGV